MTASRTHLQACLTAALQLPSAFVDDAGELAAEPGAYLVLAQLRTRLHLVDTRFAGSVLRAGWYIYSGSARGPGGIKARVGRHLRRNKAQRWHIDRVTCAAAELWAAGVSGRTECELARTLGGAEWFSYPIEGFGSSDCRTCPAHLLAYLPG